MLNINRKIVLGSGSQEEKELLKLIGLDFEVMKSDLEEIVDESLFPEEVVKSLALQKAEDLVDKIDNDAILITADTIVSHNGKLLGKPKDEQDAFNTLKLIGGDKQSVFTGMVVWDKRTDKKIVISDETIIYFKEVSDKEIWDYIKTGEPMDKAGAYGIQTAGAVHIEKIEGDYYTVVGLPINKLYDVLKQIEN